MAASRGPETAASRPASVAGSPWYGARKSRWSPESTPTTTSDWTGGPTATRRPRCSTRSTARCRSTRTRPLTRKSRRTCLPSGGAPPRARTSAAWRPPTTQVLDNDAGRLQGRYLDVLAANSLATAVMPYYRAGVNPLRIAPPDERNATVRSAAARLLRRGPDPARQAATSRTVPPGPPGQRGATAASP